MRVLLDECVPRQLKRYLRGHDVTTVPEAGWASKKNGELLQLAQSRFDAFLTVDQNLRHQLNLRGVSIAILLVLVPDNSVEEILKVLPEIERGLGQIKSGELLVVGH